MKTISKIKNTIGYTVDMIKGVAEEAKELSAIGLRAGIIHPLVSSQNMRVAEFDGFGYVIAKSEYSVAKAKSAFAVASIGQMLDGGQQVPIICTDSLYDKASDNLKRFIVAHEIGHFKNGHLEGNEKTGNMKRLIAKEYEADEYAAENIGFSNAVEALREMADVYYRIVGSKKGRLEIIERIDHLRSLEEVD